MVTAQYVIISTTFTTGMFDVKLLTTANRRACTKEDEEGDFMMIIITIIMMMNYWDQALKSFSNQRIQTPHQLRSFFMELLKSWHSFSEKIRLCK